MPSPSRRLQTRPTAVVLACTLLLLGVTALAEPPATPSEKPASAAHPDQAERAGPPAAPSSAQLKHALEELRCDEAPRIDAALTTLARSRSRKLGKPVVDRIRDGLPPALLIKAIRVITDSEQRQVARGLVELLAHRRPEVRRATIEALGMLSHRPAQRAVQGALFDPDRDVREAAATALSVLGTARSVEALLAAHDQGVRGAMQTVGELVTPGQLNKLLERAKGPQLDGVLPALERSLQRRRFAPSAKVRIIKAVATSESESARGHLERWLQEGIHGREARLSRELIQGMARIDAQRTAPADNTGPALSGSGKPQKVAERSLADTADTAGAASAAKGGAAKDPEVAARGDQ